MIFAPGRSIARRDVHLNGMIAAVQTTRVVCDDAEALLSWTAAGSDSMLRGTRDGALIRKMSLVERDRTPSMLWPRRWEGRHVLIRRGLLRLRALASSCQGIPESRLRFAGD